MIDANEAMQSFTLALQHTGLREALLQRHGQNAPATFHGGSDPIDGIFVSPSIDIIVGGYFEFGFCPHTDHRGLWLDIHYRVAFGHVMPAIVTAQARRLKTNDPRIVKKYTDVWSQFIVDHNMLERAYRIQRECTYPLAAHLQAELEALDALRREGVLQADRKCRKLPMGAIPWSPAVQSTREQVEIWGLILKKKLGRHVSSSLLQRGMLKHHIPDRIRDITIEQAIAGKRRALKEYRDMKKSSQALRQTHLEELAEAKAALGHTTKASVLRQLQTHEHQRAMARRIRYIYGSNRAGGVTNVIAPDDTGNMVEMTAKEDMEQAIMAENESKFLQAIHTPFMQQPLLRDFGYLGTGPHADAVMLGEYTIPPGVDPHTKEFIEHLAMEPAIKQAASIRTYFTTEEWKNGWRKSKERTSSGSDFLHFGHFKAGCTNDLIANFEATMANIPLLSGYSPQRWRRAVDCMLLKQAGNFRVDKLRTIVLFDPEANQNFKFLGRAVMAHAETHNQLADEQYGSRKQKTAIAHALNKRLSYDIMRQMKTAGALCSNDAKSCYDRILHSVASLCLRRLGLPEEAIVCMFSTLQNLEHTVRTVYGNSEKSYGGHLWLVPLHGIGQGNGAGPMLWAAVSTPVLKVMRSEGFGTFFRACISGETIRFVGYSFVDDTDLIQSARHSTETELEVASEMQRALNTWEGALRATGGAIVPSKSFWYLIGFQWTEGTWQYKDEHEAPATLSVKDCDGNVVQLERLPPHTARRTLGVRLAPDGNNKEEIQHLRLIAEKWNAHIRAGHLQRHEAWYALTATVMRTIEYPLLALTLSARDCSYIMAPILSRGLPACGICRNFPRDVTYAPSKFQGIGLKNIFITMGLLRIDAIVHEGQASSITGCLIRTSIEAAKLEVGLGSTLFQSNFQQFGKLATDCWIVHSWKFMHDFSIDLIEGTPALPLRRIGDRYLTSSFYSHSFKGRELLRLNRCRLFLQVTTLADISAADGKFITHDAWHGRLDATRPSYYSWPNQGDPTTRDWALWRRALSLTFCGGQARRLVIPLGSWTDQQIHLWTWFFAPAEDRLYERRGTAWNAYTLEGGRRQRTNKRFVLLGMSNEAPPLLLRATVFALDPDRYVLSSFGLEAPISHTSLPTTLAEAIEHLPPGNQWAVRRFDSTDNGDRVAQAIRAGTAIAISDGSFKDRFGTAAIVIEAEDSEHNIIAVNVVPGNPEDQGAFRSELAGLFGQVILVNTICAVHQITQGTIECGCDGKAALEKMFNPDADADTNGQHFDLLSATRAALQASPVTWTFRHVKGHQDEDLDATLDRWALLNIQMDHLAKSYWHEQYTLDQTPPHEITGEYWPVLINGRKVHSALRPTLYDEIYRKKLAIHWEKHERMSQEHSQLINWEACAQAMQRLKISRRHWVAKHTEGMCGVGKWLVIWKDHDTDDCPRCSAPEGARHVWQCPAADAKKIRSTGMDRLSQWMTSSLTAPDIQLVFTTRLSQLFQQLPFTTIPSITANAQAVLLTQDAIGWENFFEGCIAHEWEAIQEAYYQWCRSKKSGRRWTSSLIQKLWDIAWDLWEHRIGIVHSRENAERLHNMPSVDNEIRTQFRRGSHGLSRRDYYLFQGEVKDILDAPIIYRQRWLQRVETARARAERRLATTYSAERQAMRVWRQGATNAHEH